MAKRITDLGIQVGKDYDLKLEVDKSGFPESKQVDLSTLLQTSATNNVDASGNATYTADFSGYDIINLTIDQDCQLSFTGLSEGISNYLIVTKGVSDRVTFQGIGGYSDTRQTGITGLHLEIIDRPGLIYVRQLNNQWPGNLASNKFTAVGVATITSFDYVRYTLTENQCLIYGKMDISAQGETSIIINISGFPFVPKYDSEALPISCYGYLSYGTSITQGYISITPTGDGSLVFRLADALDASTLTIHFSTVIEII